MSNTHDDFIEKVDMPQEEPETSCDICGKDMFDGADAYATALGHISKEVNGFTSGEDSPWLTVACVDCGKKISEAVKKLIDNLGNAKKGG